ncbi:hypothetical protein IJI99_02665 [bacterium]|nr:hypothetical protein [bacterium]
MDNKQLDTIFAHEEDNIDKIYLHADGHWWIAYQVSSYLLQLYLWPDIKPLLKVTKKYGQAVRVGFPDKSLAKVLSQADEKHFRHLASQDNQLITITVPKINPEAYARWKAEFLSSLERIERRMHPSYGQLPLYHQVNELTSVIFHVTARLPRHLQIIVGLRLFDAMMGINSLYRQILQHHQGHFTRESLEKLDAKMDDLAYMVRIIYEQRACSSKAAMDIMERVGEIRNGWAQCQQQLKVSQKK